MKKTLVALSALVVLALTASVALADFTPQYEAKLSTTKVKENPTLTFHLEFDENDEEIGMFTAFLPKSFLIAPDEALEDGTEIGGGTVEIAAGPGCRPDAAGQIPLAPVVPITASIEERDRTDEEADAGAHAVWFLNLEPLNRVRLVITPEGKYWRIEGAPTPSDNTCNPLTVDLEINGTVDDVPLITNPAKAGKYKLMADIASQDSPTIAHFEQVVKITK